MKDSSSPFRIPYLDAQGYRGNLIWANEREVLPPFDTFSTHAEECAVCWYIVDGNVRVRQGDREVEATTGEWLFLASMDSFQYFSPGSRVLSIRFHLSLRGGTPVYPRDRHWIFSGEKAPGLIFSARYLSELIAPWRESGTLLLSRNHIPLANNLRIEGAFQNWLAEYVEVMYTLGAEMARPEKRDSRVADALARVEDHPMREPFQERDLGIACGISVSRLNRLFKQEVGVTPFVYYDRRRFDLARQTLRDTDLAVKEVAYELGFSSLSHFSTWFKQRSKMSPRAWRNDSA